VEIMLGPACARLVRLKLAIAAIVIDLNMIFPYKTVKK